MNTQAIKEFGRELRRRREEAGYTPDEFARLIGISPRTLMGVELGHQKMGDASQMRAEQILASPRDWQVGEPASVYHAVQPSALRHLAEVAASGDLQRRIQAVADALATDSIRAAEIVLAEEIRKSESQKRS